MFLHILGMLMNVTGKSIPQCQTYAHSKKSEKRNPTGSLPSKLPDQNEKYIYSVML